MDGLHAKIVALGLYFFEFIRSETALHIYTCIVIALVLSLLIITTYILHQRIRKFKSTDLIQKINGPAPQRERTIKKRIMRLNNFASSVSRTIFKNAIVLVLVGMILPGILLGVVAAKQSWIIPGPYALTRNNEPTSSTEFAKTELAVFVLNQALKGGLSDLFEVYKLDITNIENNSQNKIFSALVFIYRLLSGAVVVTIFLVGYNVIKAIPDVKLAIGKWEEKLAELQAQRAARAS